MKTQEAPETSMLSNLKHKLDTTTTTTIHAVRTEQQNVLSPREPKYHVPNMKTQKGLILIS